MTNTVTDVRLHSEVEYEDGRRDVFDFEPLHPDVLSERAARIGFEVLERCCTWTEGRDPDPRAAVPARAGSTQLTDVAAQPPA